MIAWQYGLMTAKLNYHNMKLGKQIKTKLKSFFFRKAKVLFLQYVIMAGGNTK